MSDNGGKRKQVVLSLLGSLVDLSLLGSLAPWLLGASALMNFPSLPKPTFPLLLLFVRVILNRSSLLLPTTLDCL